MIWLIIKESSALALLMLALYGWAVVGMALQ
jgi:hypothetical protein